MRSLLRDSGLAGEARSLLPLPDSNSIEAAGQVTDPNPGVRRRSRAAATLWVILLRQ